MAPFFLWPVLWLTLPALVWLIDGAAWRAASDGQGVRWHARPAVAAAEIGWWWGFGYFLAGLYWIGEAFLVEAEVFAALMPLAVLLMPAGLALFYAAATALAAPFWKHGRLARAGARPVALRRGMAARPRALRLPLERAGLCAHLSAPAHAERGRARHLRADAARGARVRPASGAVERAPRCTRAEPGWRRSPSPCCPWRCSAPSAGRGLPSPLPISCRASRSGSCSRACRSGRSGGPSTRRASSRTTSIFRGATRRESPTALAGITHVVWPEAAMPFPAARHARGAGGHRRSAAGGDGPDRRRHPGRAPRPQGARRASSTACWCSAAGACSSPSTTRSTSCPSASSCRCGACSAPSACARWPRRGGFHSGPSPRPLLHSPRPARRRAPHLLRGHLPRRDRAGAAAPGGHRQPHQRRMVRQHDGAAPAFAPGAGARGRGGAPPDPLPPTTACRRPSIAYGRVLGRLGLNVRGVIDVPLPAALPPPPYARLGDTVFFAAWLLGAALLGWGVWRQSHS